MKIKNKENFWYFKNFTPVNSDYVTHISIDEYGTGNWNDPLYSYRIIFNILNNKEKISWAFKDKEERDIVYKLFLQEKGYNVGDKIIKNK